MSATYPADLAKKIKTMTWEDFDDFSRNLSFQINSHLENKAQVGAYDLSCLIMDWANENS